MNDFENLKPSFLQAAKKKGYVCPTCGNGTGSDGTGIAEDPKNPGKYKCFKCGFYGDVVDLIGLHYGITDDAAKFEKAREYYGITSRTGKRTESPQKRTQTPPAPAEDYRDFILQAMRQNDFQYLKGRGISEETQKAFHIGFCPNWRSPKAPATVPTSPRCIIPRSSSNYLARDTRTDLTPEQKKFAKQNTGNITLFNLPCLEFSNTIFVVEGEIDAMSIYEAGGYAIGLCSAANAGMFIEHLKQNHKGQSFILMLDNDEAGQRTQATIAEDLKKLEIPFVLADYPAHDPNDFLLQDRAGMVDLISSLQAKAEAAMKEGQGNQYSALDLLDYFKNIEQQPTRFEAQTGFADLDNELSGGLHEGLYIIGAISSLGKTTFCLQLADQIAERGQDVIFFSLEMSKYEIMAKSISRNTYDIYRDSVLTTDPKRFLARNTEQILNNRKYQYYTDEEKRCISEAIKKYELQAENLRIYEGRYKGERLTVHHIRTITENFIKETGRTPVIFIDYLQIIAPADPRQSDKQNTDAAVFELKEISRDFNIPVFAISSFNRENYLEPVSMTSFKESGAVEYSSDILFGLQYAGMEYQEGDSDKKRKERLKDMMNEIYRKKKSREPIEVELKCLKNRNGHQFTLSFRMIPACNYFEPMFSKEGFQDFLKQQNTKKKAL